ncbi:hypothetical protein HEB94_006694 [Actinopolymorpha pittospori]|uniref:Uncharacterized protein n=1 Tax=Actinopolymorpha pittospori TaxID=648752 RepID=A0A927MZI6_9ACTN|nr:hypothetical protein [Actinopolymorpha pittospori]
MRWKLTADAITPCKSRIVFMARHARSRFTWFERLADLSITSPWWTRQTCPVTTHTRSCRRCCRGRTEFSAARASTARARSWRPVPKTPGKDIRDRLYRSRISSPRLAGTRGRRSSPSTGRSKPTGYTRSTARLGVRIKPVQGMCHLVPLTASRDGDLKGPGGAVARARRQGHGTCTTSTTQPSGGEAQ